MNKKEKPYSGTRWQGDPKEWKIVKSHDPTAKEKAKHDNFMKQLREAWHLDSDGRPLKDNK
ncbi:hypothetical protein [Bombilactobacillus mellifer]|uniref:hypothetical protein n=1 Tax=Bombilactobacillus mellifer TaxID=1218492 RepID=UPI0023F383D4|nr:hypothetical protein [Bombilactobacillus mellifer]MCT6826972.1 hypothetical protein [Bombilactobacillus mellifer]